MSAFFVSSEGPRPNEDRFNPTELTTGELDAIRRYLDKNVVHRQQYSQTQLSLLLDGKRESVFDLQSSRVVEFDLGIGSELIEIRSVGSVEEDASLAVCLLQRNHSGILPLDSSMALGKGMRLSLTVVPLTDDAGEGRGAKLKVGYEQTAPVNPLVKALRQIGLWGAWRNDLIGLWPRVRPLTPTLAVLLIGLSAIGLWAYFHSGRSVANPGRVAQLQTDHGGESARSSVPPIPPAAQVEPATPHREIRQAPLTTASPGEATARTAKQTNGIERTRGTEGRLRSAPLLAIKRIYVDPLGKDSFSQELREKLIVSLRALNRFEVVENRDDADAVFRGSTAPGPKPGSNPTVILALVNAGGQVIWSLSPQTNGRVLPSSAADGAAEISNTLLRDIERQGRQ
jgi:hypothetical protein